MALFSALASGTGVFGLKKPFRLLCPFAGPFLVDGGFAPPDFVRLGAREREEDSAVRLPFEKAEFIALLTSGFDVILGTGSVVGDGAARLEVASVAFQPLYNSPLSLDLCVQFDRRLSPRPKSFLVGEGAAS